MRNCLLIAEAAGACRGLRHTDIADAIIENNTIWASGASVDANNKGMQLSGTGTANTSIRNNIVSGFVDNTEILGSIATGTYSHNLFSNTDSFGTDAIQSEADTDTFVNPSATPGTGDFRLKAGSAAIDSGVDLSGSFTDDIEGTTRTGDWDRGAYNASSGGAASGSGGATSPLAVAAGVGSAAHQSTGSAATPLPVAAGTGTATPAPGTATGSGGAIAPLPVAAGAGTAAHQGAGGAVVPLPAPAGTGAATGPGSAAGAGGALAPLPAATGAGLAAHTGAGGATAPLPTAAGTGTPTHQGAGGAVAPVPTATGSGYALLGNEGAGAYGTPMSTITGSRLVEPPPPASGSTLPAGSFADRLRLTAARLLDRFGNTATFHHPIKKEYSPTGGGVTQAGTTSVTCKVVVSGTLKSLVDALTSTESDIALLVSAKLLGFRPLPGITTVEIESQTYAVVELLPIRAQNFDIVYKVRIQ
jgi:hypothetical protein